MLEKYYADKGGLTDARLRMARVPDGAELIRNYLSGAPGIRLGNLFILAGVPHICAGMLDALTGTLEGGKPLVSVTVGAWAAESEVADMLRQVEQAHEGVAIGSYPFFKQGRVGANFVVRSEEERLARDVAGQLESALQAAGYEAVVGGI
jgi:molybdopterin-biosynthesis enzyme MoeA-like protein